jgi:hypothetical protein
MKAILAGVVTAVSVYALIVWLVKTHTLVALAIAAMLGIAVAVTYLCGQEPQVLPQAIDWYWFGAFGLAWALGTLGLTAIDGLTSRGRLEAEAVLLAAAVMGYSLGHLAGLRRARPGLVSAPPTDGEPPAG